MIDFAGRTAFVTGGANGVGIGIVRNLLNEGARWRSPTSAGRDRRRARQPRQPRGHGRQLNVMDREGFKAAADKVEAEFGPVSLLFNNAGINLFQTIEDFLVRRLGLGARGQPPRRDQRRRHFRARG
jgi:NAD(P)-dependent dehydrogenase (short-subunit alcohol dehydrogenase family)